MVTCACCTKAFWKGGGGGHHLTAANTTKGGGGGHFRLIQGYMHMSLVILNTLTFITSWGEGIQ